MKLLVLVALAACGKPANSDGTERGACYGNGTCNAGLACMSNRCVRLPAADCDSVADALASIELGNYAPKEQRAPRVAALVAICKTQHLSKDDAECILAARTKEQLAFCPRPLIVASSIDPKAPKGLPASCTEYLRMIEQYASCPKQQPEVALALRKSVVDMRKSWSAIGPESPMPRQVDEACTQGIGAMKAAMQQLGCP